MSTVLECDNEQLADRLYGVIKPYYKGLRRPGENPEFRKCLKSTEVEDILISLHELVVELKTHP